MQLGARGTTVFVSSHLLAEIQAACDSIVMIDHGGAIFTGSIGDLLARHSPTIRAAAQDATDTARLIELVADAGYPATRVNGAIEIAAPAHFTAELNRLAWHAGITLGELQATSADLEQAFFAMTGDTPKGTS